jgi:hypothetical protein
MFFVWMGRLVAAVALLGGLWNTVLGFIYAGSNDQALFRRYIPGKTTGEAIDAGIEYLVVGIVVGLLCHIADSVALLLARD